MIFPKDAFKVNRPRARWEETIMRMILVMFPGKPAEQGIQVLLKILEVSGGKDLDTGQRKRVAYLLDITEANLGNILKRLRDGGFTTAGNGLHPALCIKFDEINPCSVTIKLSDNAQIT